MALGNKEAVQQANEKERQPRAAASPAKETAERRTAETPERPEAKPPAKPKLTPEEEFTARVRHNLPHLTDAEIDGLRKEFLKTK